MYRIYKSLIFLFFIAIPISLSAHVQHYDNISRIEFDIFRNNKNIGKHIFSFRKLENQLEIVSEINFEIKKFGVVLYKYHVKGTEYYKDGKLIKFNSKTNQNGKKKYVNLKLENEELVIDGSSFKGKVSADYLLGTWWNHSIVESDVQISAVSGRIIKQKSYIFRKRNIKYRWKNLQYFTF